MIPLESNDGRDMGKVSGFLIDSIAFTAARAGGVAFNGLERAICLDGGSGDADVMPGGELEKHDITGPELLWMSLDGEAETAQLLDKPGSGWRFRAVFRHGRKAIARGEPTPADERRAPWPRPGFHPCRGLEGADLFSAIVSFLTHADLPASHAEQFSGETRLRVHRFRERERAGQHPRRPARQNTETPSAKTNQPHAGAVSPSGVTVVGVSA